MKALLALALALSLTPLAAQAQAQRPPAPAQPAPRAGQANAAEQAAIIQRVNNYFNTLSDISGDFMQIGPDGGQTRGKFYLSRPGKVRFDYARPSTLQLLSDGTTVAVRDRKAATQDVYLLSQTPLRILLAERVDLMKDSTVLSVSQGSSDLTTVTLEERTIAGTGRLSIVFEGPGFELRQWTVTDPQGLSTTVAVYNLEKAAKKFDAQLFKIPFEY